MNIDWIEEGFFILVSLGFGLLLAIPLSVLFWLFNDWIVILKAISFKYSWLFSFVCWWAFFQYDDKIK